MNKKIVLGMMLTLLLISMSTLAFKIEQVSAVDSPYIAVVPDTIIDPTLTPGKNFTVSIYTDYTGSDIWGWQFTLSYYDPSVIHGVEVVNGDLITTDKNPNAQFLPGEFNNTEGTLSLTAAFFFFMPPTPITTSGPGILANVTFMVVGVGTSNISLGVETQLKSPDYDIVNAEWMPNQIGHGYFSNIDGLPSPLITTVNIKPDSLNLRNKGQWIKAYIKLPEDTFFTKTT